LLSVLLPAPIEETGEHGHKHRHRVLCRYVFADQWAKFNMLLD
jgi:hypothetical protein